MKLRSNGESRVSPTGGGRTRDLPSHPFSGGDLFISVKAVEWVFLNSKSSGNARNVLLVLAAHYREGTAWLGYENIAKLANVSRPTLSKAISELEDLGELQVEREEGRVNNYSFPQFEAVKTGKVLGPNQLSSDPKPVNPSLPKELVLEKLKAEEGVSPLPLRMEEGRPQPKPVKELKVRRGFQKTLPPKREYVPAPKQPESWLWFSTVFKHLSDVNAVTMQELWPMVDEMLAELSREEAENRLSVYIQGASKISGFLAKDFLAGGWRTVDEKEAGDIQGIVNEE